MLRWLLTRSVMSKHPTWHPEPALAVTYLPLWGKVNFHLASVCQVSRLYLPCQNQSKGRVVQKCSSSQPVRPPENISLGGSQAFQEHLSVCWLFKALCRNSLSCSQTSTPLKTRTCATRFVSLDNLASSLGCLCQSSCSNCSSRSSQVSCSTKIMGTWETRGCNISSCCVPFFSCVVISRGRES